jgi:hypothetical protein
MAFPSLLAGPYSCLYPDEGIQALHFGLIHFAVFVFLLGAQQPKFGLGRLIVEVSG